MTARQSRRCVSLVWSFLLMTVLLVFVFGLSVKPSFSSENVLIQSAQNGQYLKVDYDGTLRTDLIENIYDARNIFMYTFQLHDVKNKELEKNTKKIVSIYWPYTKSYIASKKQLQLLYFGETDPSKAEIFEIQESGETARFKTLPYFAKEELTRGFATKLRPGRLIGVSINEKPYESNYVKKRLPYAKPMLGDEFYIVPIKIVEYEEDVTNDLEALGWCYDINGDKSINFHAVFRNNGPTIFNDVRLLAIFIDAYMQSTNGQKYSHDKMLDTLVYEQKTNEFLNLVVEGGYPKTALFPSHQGFVSDVRASMPFVDNAETKYWVEKIDIKFYADSNNKNNRIEYTKKENNDLVVYSGHELAKGEGPHCDHYQSK